MIECKALILGFHILCPPAEYAAHPMPEQVVVYRMSAMRVRANCGLLHGIGSQYHACAVIGPNKCFVYLPNDVPAPVLEALTNHELAHCKGWRHD